jgi:hypothetical protein
MKIMRSVPDVPAAKLSAWETFKLWFAMNRKPIGGILTTLSAIAFAASFEHHNHVAAILSGIATIVSAGTAGAGTFHNDQYHEERAHAEIGMRSGRFPAYQRRSTDKPKGNE